MQTNSLKDDRFIVVAKETYAAGDVVVLQKGTITGPLIASLEMEGCLEDGECNIWQSNGNHVECDPGYDIAGALELNGNLIPKTHAAITIGHDEVRFNLIFPQIPEGADDVSVPAAVLTAVFVKLGDSAFYKSIENEILAEMNKMSAEDEPLYRSEKDA